MFPLGTTMRGLRSTIVDAGIAMICAAVLWPAMASATNRVDISTGKTGQPVADTIFLGSPYEFRVAIQNDTAIVAMTLGLLITSPDGAEWRWDSQPDGYGPSGPGTGGQYVTVFPGSRLDPPSFVFDLSGLYAGERSMDGISPDTSFIGGLSLNSSLPAGPLQDMMAIHFTALRTGTGEVGTLCVDSCFVPPGGPWLFVNAETSEPATPDFDGPFCWPVASNPGLKPMIVVAFSPVNIIVTDPDSLQIGKDSQGNLINEISGATYYEDPHDSIVIDDPKIGTYDIGFIAEEGAPEGATFSSIIKIDGLQENSIVVDASVPDAGAATSFDYTVDESYTYTNGDANHDETINIEDAVFLIQYIFSGGPAPEFEAAGDADCDGTINIQDPVLLINYIFKGGQPPCYFPH
jgi:hypothetical protein